MKIGLTGILSKPSTRLSSHNAGNTFYVKSKIEEKFGLQVDIVDMEESEDFDTIVLTEGVNFRKGIFNLFGGVSEGLISRLRALDRFTGDLYSFGPEDIDYTPLVEKRIPDLEFKMPRITKLTENDFDCSRFILGDSHSLSVYEKGYALSRNDGKTLHGFLRDGIAKYLPTVDLDVFRFYAGNIDIRHHLCRLYSEGQEFKAIDSMIDDLENQLSDLTLEGVNSIEIVELLPIENESRKLPKTGYFEGKPFHGSWYLRDRAKNYFNLKLLEMCERNGFNFLKWPDMTNEYGELDFKYMEARQSVHIAPKYYMFKNTFI